MTRQRLSAVGQVGRQGLFIGPGVGVLMLLAGSAGCTTTLRASTTQPNPMAYTHEATQRSDKVYIDVRDMELPRTFKLRQSAYFAVVSKERLRFHVMLVHKWKEVADPTTWHARLEDDRGHTYLPESQELSYDDHVTRIWDHERRVANLTMYGDLNTVRPTLAEGDTVYDNYGYAHRVHNERVTLDSLDVFQGAGDVVFHAKDLLNRGVRKLTLTLERSGYEYKFTWNLIDLIDDDNMAAEPDSRPSQLN